MTARHAALLGALAAIWGGSYLLIAFGLEDLEPIVVVWVRTVVGAVTLLVVMGPVQRATVARDVRARPSRALLLGATAIAAPFLLISYGELEVPSGLTAVLLAPSSLFVAMLAPWLDVSERVGRGAYGGMAIGLAGVGLLVGVETVSTLWEFLGAMAVIGAALSYALATFVVKNTYAGLPSVVVSAVSVGTAALVTTPWALAALPDQAPSLRAVLALLVLGVVGTALAFVIFYRLIAEIGAGRASLIAYLAPGFALFYGAAFNDEAVTVAAVGGLVLILAGVALASRR